MNRTFAVFGLSILLGAGALGLPACNSSNVRTEPVPTTMLNPDATPLPSDGAGTTGHAKKHATIHRHSAKTTAAPTATAVPTPTVAAELTPISIPAATPASKPCGKGLLWVLLLLLLILAGGWFWAKRNEKNDELPPSQNGGFGSPPPPPPAGKGGNQVRDVLAPKDSSRNNPPR